VAKWLKNAGGLAAMQAVNERKAAKLYAESIAPVLPRPRRAGSRSRMNVTFRLPSRRSKRVRQGLDGGRLDGQRATARSAACARRSTTPSPRGIDTLVSFMQEFERTKG
jgi:phosphoserine aminotransferase